jgi:hypothetical protein
MWTPVILLLAGGWSNMESKRKLLTVRSLITTLAVVIVGLIWYGIASPDQDWLWFLPVFNEDAARIYLYRDGQKIVLVHGDWGYEEVNEAVNQIVRQVEAKESLGISLDMQQEYYDQFSAVEVFYAEPVIIHTRHGFPKADKYLFPQSGRHSDPPVVFAGMQRQADYRGGALVLGSRERLDAAVDAVWAAQ